MNQKWDILVNYSSCESMSRRKSSQDMGYLQNIVTKIVDFMYLLLTDYACVVNCPDEDDRSKAWH